MAEGVDYTARSDARAAGETARSSLAAIEAHEKLCAERQIHISETLVELKKSLANLYGLIIRVALGIISLLIIALATAGVMYMFPPDHNHYKSEGTEHVN